MEEGEGEGKVGEGRKEGRKRIREIRKEEGRVDVRK